MGERGPGVSTGAPAKVPAPPPIARTQPDSAYLDFCSSLRAFYLSDVAAAQQRAAAAVLDQQPGPVSDLAELRRLLDPVPVVAVRNRLMRSIQEMLWRRVVAVVHDRRDELLAELARAEQAGPGSVSYDPAFGYPEYLTRQDFHLMPGSYQDDPLAGYIYHYGTNLFYAGRNDHDEIKRRNVELVTEPADGVLENVLELACAVGQSTVALKQRFPWARVVGTDIAAPMVRYAHKRAVELGVEVEFAQQAAEDLQFPDASFDLVFVNILFHEVPSEIAERAVAQAHRVLRPGGRLVVLDIAPRLPGAPKTLWDYNLDIGTRYNAEPYASDFASCDFTALLRRHFPDVDTGDAPQNAAAARGRWICQK